MPISAIIVIALFFLFPLVGIVKMIIESIQEGETLSAALLIVFSCILISIFFYVITTKKEYPSYHIVLRDSANTILKDTIYTGGDFEIYRNGCIEFADDTKSYCGYTLTTERVK